jgi:hypothetical protein
MSVTELIGITVSESQSGTVLATFDRLGIVAGASDTPPSDMSAIRAKGYTANSDGLAAVGEEWGDASGFYAAFAKAISQAQKPAMIYGIKRDSAVAVENTITFATAIATGHTINAVVNGTTITVPFNTDAATTYGDFETAIEAVEGIAAAVVAGDVITVTASSEYELSISCSASGSGAPAVAVAVSVPGRTIRNDISDAIAEDDTNQWYGISTVDSSKGLVLSAAAFIETTEKLYFARTDEAATKTSGGTTSLGYVLNNLKYRRTVLFWHHVPNEYIDTAALAMYLGNDPGTLQLFGRSLVGVTPSPTSQISAAEVTVLKLRSVNTYRKFGPTGMITQGRRVDGQVVEATRDTDSVVNDLRQTFLTFLSQTKKPSYDGPGFAAIQAQGDGVARRSVTNNILRSDRPVVFTIPQLEDIDPADYAAQVVPGCNLSGTLKKGVNKIDINLNVQL